MKYAIYILIFGSAACLSCRHPSDADNYLDSINQYPTIFQNLESDVYYFQGNNLIKYDHLRNAEAFVLSAESVPYEVKRAENRCYLFYAERSQSLMRFDVKQRKEIEMRKDVSEFYPSFDGNKVIYAKPIFDVKLYYYNLSTGVDYSLSDTSIQICRIKNRRCYIVERDTFYVPPFTSSEVRYDYVQNRDSTFAYYRDEILNNYGKGYILNLTTNELRTLLEDKGERTVYSIDYSPSGKQVVFSMYLVNAGQSYVFAANADGSSPSLISNKRIGSLRALFVSSQ